MERFDIFISDYLSKIGEKVARAPFLYISVSLLVALFFSTGVQQLKYEANPEYLFVPDNARSLGDREVLHTWFPTNFSRFSRGTETRLHMVCDIIVEPKYGEEILDSKIWKEVHNMVQAIQRIQVMHEEIPYRWNNLCVRFQDKCVDNSFLNLYGVINNITLTYPLMKDERNNKIYPLVAHIGGTKVEGDKLLSGRVLKVTFILDDSTKRRRILGEIWTQVVRMYVTSINFQHIQVNAVTDKTIEKELSANIDSSLQKVPITIVLVLMFTIYNCLSTDWVRSKPILGVVSLLVSCISSASASGLAMYCGVPWQSINIMTIFLLIGIGLDDTFVILSAWWRTENQGCRDVVARMSMTYADAAVTITITTMTNIITFIIGAAMPGFPSVHIFCIYTGIGLTFLYLWTLFIFGGFLTLAGHLEHSNRHCLLFVQVKSKTDAEDDELGWLYTVFLQGGTSRRNPFNLRDCKDGKLMVFFRDSVAPMLKNKWNKTLIILVFLAYLGVSVYGILNMKEGLERSKLVGDYSYSLPFFQLEDLYFRNNPYRLQIMINEPLDYSNETVQNQVKQILHQLEDSKFVSNNTAFRQSWLHLFLDTVDRNFLFFDVSTPALFVENLGKFLRGLKDTPIFDDVVFSENKQTVLASRFFLQSDALQNAEEEVQLLETVRRIADDAPFNVIVYHPFFCFFDQFLEIKTSTLQCVIMCCICMTLVTLLFIPDKICVIWVCFTIISVQIGIIGLMSFLKISLDTVSMIVIIMGIGFSVDYSAHISYHFLSFGQEMSQNDRLSHCLYALGPPIVRGGFTTVISTAGLYFHPSYITSTFAKMMFLIVLLGCLHGLLLLPVLLSIFAPGMSKHKTECKQMDMVSPSAITLSETFVYQTTISNNKRYGLHKRFGDSLRKLVLSGDGHDMSVDYKNFDLTHSSIGSFGSCEDYSGCETEHINLRGVQRLITSEGTLDTRPRSNSDSVVTMSNSQLSPQSGNMLPYYKFAHVKRTAVLPDARYEPEHQNEQAVLRISEMKMHHLRLEANREFPAVGELNN